MPSHAHISCRSMGKAQLFWMVTETNTIKDPLQNSEILPGEESSQKEQTALWTTFVVK